MKKRTIFLAAMAVMLVLSATIGSAMAYFTTNASAVGSYALTLGNSSEVNETFGAWTKNVTVTNTGDAPIYVRARAFAGDDYTLLYEGDSWTPGADGYYYYNSVLEGSADTEALKVVISGGLTAEGANPAEGDAFNVAVVYETAPVQYNESGSIIPAMDIDWSTINMGTRTETVEGGAEQ